MTTFHLEIVTPEKRVYAEDVDMVVVPGAEGQLGILPHHAPLMTMLQPGEIKIHKASEDSFLCVTGGFLEVRQDRVIILADSCERAEEIDISRAEEARKRAEEVMAEKYAPGVSTAETEAALRRSLARIRVAERRGRRGRPGL